MGMRDAIGKSKAGTVIVSVIVLAAAALFIRSGTRGRAEPQGYFFDVASGELFSAGRLAVPPIDAPGSGAGKGVRAYVYSCGDCSESQRTIAYLTTFTPEARDILTAEPALDPQTPEEAAAAAAPENREELEETARRQGQRIARPPETAGEEPQWIASFSPKGTALRQAHRNQCPENRPRTCFP